MRFLLVLMLVFISNVSLAEIYSSAKCEAITDEINKDLEKSNFCSKDNECKIWKYGSSAFNCTYPYINKSIDESSILIKIESLKSCRSGSSMECAVIEPICINNKCVPGKIN